MGTIDLPMRTRPKISIERLREIGWEHWDPIDLKGIAGLIGLVAQWPEDEYDTYLLKAAADLWNGKTEAQVAAYLLKVEVRTMGLGDTPGASGRAARVTTELAKYVGTLRA